MPDHDLHTFMAQVTAEMASEYDRIYARAAEDPGTTGDAGEENWASLFKKWLPPAYHIETKGRLIGHDGTMSKQIDIVVLKPAYPRQLLEKKVWLAGGVAAAFECKTTLTAAHITQAIDRAEGFKSLYAVREGTPRKELVSPLIYGLLAHSHSWKGKKSDHIANVERALQLGLSKVSHPRFELDVLCVADLATWSKTYISKYDANWQPQSETNLKEVFGGPFGPMTSMNCSWAGSQMQQASFRPVGALLNELTRQIAWADPSVRDIAEYFTKANLGGSGSGQMRAWPLSVYSAHVAQQIAAGRNTTGVLWDEWAMIGF